MIQESRQNEAADRKRREVVEARNMGDSLAYQTEKTLKELGDKVPSVERQNIQSKIEALREAIKGEDVGKIKQLSDELQNAFHALSQQLYAQQPGDNGHGPSHMPQPEDEGEVIEGEYR
jgi:molecular chaperone DnaK